MPRTASRALLATIVMLISVTAASSQAASIVAKPTTSAPSYYVLRKAKEHCRANYTRTKVTLRVKHGKRVVKHTQIRCVAKQHIPSSASTTSPATFPPDLPTATVTVTVIPSANNHTYATRAGMALTVGAPGVLAGATGIGLSAVLVSGPAHGSLTLHRDGSFTYAPAIAASGIEQFVYRVSSTDGESSTAATVTLKVTPVAAGSLFDVAANGTLQVPAGGLLAPDVGSGLTAQLVGSTADGTVSVGANGSATYTPDVGFSGADSFTYHVVDASGQTSNTATVTIVVGAQPPSVVSETFAGAIGNTELQVEGVESASPEVYLTGTSALAGDSDPNGGSLSTVPGQITTSQGGSVTMGSEGNFSYEPPAGFRGSSDSFTYTVSESEGLTASATATVNFAGGVVWYVDDAATGTGNGTSAAPFASTADLTQAQSGDTIFLFAGSSDYAGGITLPGGVALVGAGATLTADGETLLAQSGPMPVLTNSGGAGITVGEGDSIAGLDVANTSGDGIAASAVDGFTVASSVSISDAHGDGLDVTGGDGTIDFAATIAGSSDHSVAIQQRTTGSAVRLSGSITDHGEGVLLNNNAGTTVFSGQLTASTAAHPAFVATNAGAIAATGAANTLATTTAQALTISGTTTIGPAPADLDFASVSAGNGSAGPAYGIEITGTGASSQGDVNIDGGVIENATTDGVSISGQAAVTVEDMTIESSAGDGVLLVDAQTPTLSGNTITGSGGDGIQISGSGSSDPQLSITDNTLTGQVGTAVVVDLAGGGDGLIKGNAIGTATAASGSTNGDGVGVTSSGGVLILGVEDNSVEGIRTGSALDAVQQGSADLELTVAGPGQALNIDSSSSANAVEVDSASSSGTLCLAANGNSITDPHAGTAPISVDQEDSGSFFAIQGYAGAATDDSAVETYLGAGSDNIFTGGALAQSSGAGFVGAECEASETVTR